MHNCGFNSGFDKKDIVPKTAYLFEFSLSFYCFVIKYMKRKTSSNHFHVKLDYLQASNHHIIATSSYYKMFIV